MKKFLIAGALNFILIVGGVSVAHAAAVLPTLPQKQVDVTMPTVNGSTLNATCSTLQAQLNAAAALDVNLTHQIILATGSVCTGPYVLRSHNGGTGWILIKGQNYASLPSSGTRVSPADAALMPVVKYGEDGVSHYGAFSAETGAQRYRIIGISMVQDSTRIPNWSLVATGYGAANFLNTGYIIIDRCVMRDTDLNHPTYRGVFMNAERGNTAVLDSYIDGMKDIKTINGQDTQAILITANPGPSLIQNNYLRAAGENFMVGGGGTPSDAVMPRDITFRLNTVDKDPAWSNTVNTVKTLTEFKNGQRILVEGNDFINMPWYDGGFVFRLTVRGGNETWNDVSDLTIRNNLAKNITNFINSFGSDDFGNTNPAYYTKHSKRWHIYNNLIYGLGSNCGGGASCGVFYAIGNGGNGTNCTDPTPTCKNEDITIAHNTVDGVVGSVLSVYSAGQINFDFKDNLINSNGSYGIFGGGASNLTVFGTNLLNYAWGTTWSMINNRIASIGGNSLDSSYYPAGTNSYPSSYTSFLWTNPTAGDYTLQSGSPAKNTASDGTDQGVNFTLYTAARSGSTVTPTSTPDTTAPSRPTGLVATAISSSQVNLSWTASTDNVGVVGYRIYRNSVQITTAAGTTYSDTGLTASTAYSYTVSAYDTSNNTSVQSASVSATTQAAPVVATTPVGLWTFDTTDLTTATALDTSGLSNTLTLVSTPARVTGKVNQALSFDGIASTASCTDASCGGTTKLDMGTSDWTASAWVKSTAASGGAIVSKTGFMCGGNPDGWMTYISNTGKFQASLNDSAGGCVFSSNDGITVTDGVWHLLTAVYTRSGNLVRYVDGAQTGTATSITSLNGTSIDAASAFMVGSRDVAGDSMYLNGSVDDVRVYPRALSLSDIQILYAAGTPDITVPTVSLSAPTNGTVLSGTATVSATASDNVGISGVQFLLNGASLGIEDITSPYSITWDTISATNASYTLSARARDAAGNQATASAVTVTVNNTTTPPVDTTAPTTPTGLTATAVSSSQINFVWTASTDAVGVTGYRIYRNGTQLTTTTGTTYSDSGLTASTAYTYTVAAYDAAGNVSTQSSGVAATTQAVATPPPVTTTTSTPPAPVTTPGTITTPSTGTVPGSGGSGGGSGTFVPSTPVSVQTPSTPSVPKLNLPPLTRTLYRGLSHSEVTTLQTFLQSKGYLTTTPTGFYGSQTRAAVARYQCDTGITCTGSETTTGYGMVGTKTRASINQALGATTTTPTTTGSLTITLYQGMKGTQVSILQALLIAKGYLSASSATGYYGSLTTAAVKQFQCANNIVCSGTPATTGYGVVGARTRVVLNGR